MSHPFTGTRALPFATFDVSSGVTKETGNLEEGKKPSIQDELAALDTPRKHYKWYNSMAPAAHDWDNPAQGMAAFLRGYIHLKSAAWPGNHNIQPLKGWIATELAKMPSYYVLPLHSTMPEAIAATMATVPATEQDATKAWLSDADLEVYVNEWSRTGFQGGLNWYRTGSDPERMRDVDLFAGAQIIVPATFISGASDWGNYQEPHALEQIPKLCKDLRGIRFIEGAGHWPQQEQPERVVKEFLDFLAGL